MRVTLRQARLAVAVVVAAVMLYGIAGPFLHADGESHRAPLHGLGLCLVLFALAGSFLVPRPCGAVSRRGRGRFAVAAPVVLAPRSRPSARHTIVWLQRFLN